MSGNKKKKKKKPQRIDGFKRHAQTWTHSWRGRFTLVAKNHIPADPSELPLRGTAVEFAFPYARQCTVSCNNYTSFHTQIKGQSSTRREREKRKKEKETPFNTPIILFLFNFQTIDTFLMNKKIDK